jgi:hypothetical protein
MIVIRLLLFVCAFAGLCQAQTWRTDFHPGAKETKSAAPADSTYLLLPLSDLTACSPDYRGKRIAVTAEVISIDARLQAIELFDAQSRKLMGVSLTRLPKAQRRALAHEPARRVSVYGSLAAQAGRCVITAHKVVPIPADTLTREAGR